MNCEDVTEEHLPQSTFVLIVAPDEDYFASTEMLSNKLLRAIRSGAIPVILGAFPVLFCPKRAQNNAKATEN